MSRKQDRTIAAVFTSQVSPVTHLLIVAFLQNELSRQGFRGRGVVLAEIVELLLEDADNLLVGCECRSETLHHST